MTETKTYYTKSDLSPAFSPATREDVERVRVLFEELQGIECVKHIDITCTERDGNALTRARLFYDAEGKDLE